MPVLQRGSARLAYEIAGSPNAPAVVYIPGLGNHSTDSLSSYLTQALEPVCRLLIPDSRGAGRTQVPPGSATSPDEMADDLAAILDAEGIEQAHIFGYSLGTGIALAFALRHPGRVSSLALAAGFAHIPLPSRTSFILEAMRDLRASGGPRELINRFNALYLISEPLFEHDGLITKWVNGEPGPHTQTEEGFTLQTEAFRSFDVRGRLHEIAQPVFVLSSPDDLLVPPHFQEELARGLSNARLKSYPGGHGFVALPFNFPTVMDDLHAFWGL
ncbi:MAG: alpha/beta fold hydrolase [Anaerolineae bacterium]|nr:alpha/beta fold hydrolase [Anaerolineae bacterium]